MDQAVAVPNPEAVKPRFKLYVDRVDHDDEPDWRYKLRLVDRAWIDPEGFPVDAVMAGDSWPAAWQRAMTVIGQALRSTTCIFY